MNSADNSTTPDPWADNASVLDSSSPARRWTLVFGALSALYIFIEFAFNAELVNLASSAAADHSVMELMARKGEILSGLGLSIVLMGLLERYKQVSKRYGFVVATLTLALLAYIGVQFMSWAQPAIVNSVVSSSSPEDRAKALNMMLFKHGAAEGSIIFDGKRIGGEAHDRVLLALLGPMAYANEATQQKLLESQSDIIKNLVLSTNDGADQQSWKQYQQVSSSIRARYDEYVKHARSAHGAKSGVGQNTINQTLAQLRQQSSAQYAEYQKASLAFLRTNPRASDAAFEANIGYPKGLSKGAYLAHPKVCVSATARMHKQGIMVPSDWCPVLEGSVVQALQQKNSDTIDATWTKRSKQMFGEVVPKTLSEKQFRNLPAIKRSIASALAPLPCTKGNAYLSATQFSNQCVLPDVKKGVNSLMETYSVNIAQLADGAKYEERGKAAVRALVVPPVAIMFSLFFSLLALTKYLGRFRSYAVAAILVLPLILPTPNNEIADFLLASGDTSWSITNAAIKWVMAVEPVVYSVSEGFIEIAHIISALLVLGFGIITLPVEMINGA